MSTTSGWKRHDYKRVCDICGHPFKFSQLTPIGELKWACSDDYKGLTAIQISRHNARARPLRVRPVKHPKPLNSIDTYQLEEATIFNFIMKTAPADTPDGASDISAAAQAARYLGNIVAEGKRPAAWTTPALAKVVTLCDYLLTRQFGSPTGANPAGAVSDSRYGGLVDPVTLGYAAYQAGLAGSAWIVAYGFTGNANYLLAADRAAMFCRAMQCSDLFVTNHKVVFPLGGGAYHTGGLTSAIDGNALVTGDLQYPVHAGIVLRFLTQLMVLRGASHQYGVASSADFSASTIATLGTMQSELAGFLSVGVHDATTGTIIAGLSTASPADYYDPFISAGTGAGSWHVATRAIVNWAWPIYALDQAGLGGTAPRTAYDYAMTFTSNPANRVTSPSESVLLAGRNGTYDPTYTVASDCNNATKTESTNAYYDWDWFGLLASVQSKWYPAAFKRAKDALSIPRRLNTKSIDVKYIGLNTNCGLSFQVAQSTFATPRVTSAANLGNCYRYGNNHVPQLRGN